jgi:hypothetical protein
MSCLERIIEIQWYVNRGPVAQASACGSWSLQRKNPQAEACAAGFTVPQGHNREMILLAIAGK